MKAANVAILEGLVETILHANIMNADQTDGYMHRALRHRGGARGGPSVGGREPTMHPTVAVRRRPFSQSPASDRP